MSDKISKKYEARHLVNTWKAKKAVQGVYEKTIDKIFKQTGSMVLKGEVFNINDFPIIKATIDAALQSFYDKLITIVTNAKKDDWELSGDKHAEIISSIYKGKTLSDAVNLIVYDKHETALNAFLNENAKGLKLSDSVWNYTNQFQSEIEQGLFTGISEGMSAVQMAQEQKQYLLQPDKLFRRVKNAKGELVLSKAAKQNHPGQGIYRSSFKNAFRMTRNQTNFAYRTADHTRWAATPFLLGIEVMLSNNHPHYDMCDKLVGLYPSSFLFRGFHISCICFAVPKLASDKQFDAYENAVLAGKKDQFNFSEKVNELPASAKQWVDANQKKLMAERIRHCLCRITKFEMELKSFVCSY